MARFHISEDPFKPLSIAFTYGPLFGNQGKINTVQKGIYGKILEHSRFDDILIVKNFGSKGNMEIANRIMVDEKIRFGKPVIKGTRVPVYLVIGKLAGGLSYEEVMLEYEITKEDILAALNYAANHLSDEEVRAVA
jgi:uncharacterized protein (DUF433 family)